jgi:Ser-tRNA(Ala) deacylase AlaX
MAATSRKQQAWISRSDRWHVVLSETVIFVEGGGQPSDHGSVGSRGVLRVFWDAQGSLVRPSSSLSFGPPMIYMRCRSMNSMGLLTLAPASPSFWIGKSASTTCRFVPSRSFRLQIAPQTCVSVQCHKRARCYVEVLSQHHTAQHLISALALRDFGWKTSSWALGADEAR